MTDSNPDLTTRVGRFLSLKERNHLILQITARLASGCPLSGLKFEELKIVRMACLLVLGRGLELLILRECHRNLGVCENAILNRKIHSDYWLKLYQLLRQLGLSSTAWSNLTDEETATRVIRDLLLHTQYRHLIQRFFKEECGLAITLPEEILKDGNLLFALGTVFGHRLFRLTAFFTESWGKEPFEPVMRLICQKLWFFYLIVWGKIIVSPKAFAIQRSDHEVGFITFLLNDYRTFTGTLFQLPKPLKYEHRIEVQRLLNIHRLPIINPQTFRKPRKKRMRIPTPIKDDE